MKVVKKSNIIWARIGGYIASIAPILAVIGFNWNDYTETTVGTIKLSIGAIICLAFLFLKSIGKLKFPEKRVVLYLIIFGLAYLLESVLYDLTLISGAALIGEIVELPITHKADLMEKQMKIDETAKATAQQIKAIAGNKVQETSGRV